MRRDACLHRIQMYIAAGLQEIIVLLHQAGFIAILEDVPAECMPMVVIHGVLAGQRFHEMPDFNVSGLDEKMKMIGHETVGMQLTALLFGLPAQKCEKHLIITAVLKDGHSSYAAFHKVVARTGKPCA